MGKIIVIEGIDCSGKETQMKYLKEWLQTLGYQVKTISFPNYCSATGKILGGPFLGKKDFLPPLFLEGANHVDAKTSTLLYAADRAYNRKDLQKLKEESDYVIIDRYVYSAMAYQGSKIPKEEQQSFFEWIEKIEFDFLELPKPDLCLYLDLSIKEVQTFLRKRKDQDQNEKDLKYLIECQAVYAELAKKYSFQTIDCRKKSPKEIAEEIKKIVQNS